MVVSKILATGLTALGLGGDQNPALQAQVEDTKAGIHLAALPPEDHIGGSLKSIEPRKRKLNMRRKPVRALPNVLSERDKAQIEQSPKDAKIIVTTSTQFPLLEVSGEGTGVYSFTINKPVDISPEVIVPGITIGGLSTTIPEEYHTIKFQIPIQHNADTGAMEPDSQEVLLVYNTIKYAVSAAFHRAKGDVGKIDIAYLIKFLKMRKIRVVDEAGAQSENQK